MYLGFERRGCASPSIWQQILVLHCLQTHATPGTEGRVGAPHVASTAAPHPEPFFGLQHRFSRQASWSGRLSWLLVSVAAGAARQFSTHCNPVHRAQMTALCLGTRCIGPPQILFHRKTSLFFCPCSSQVAGGRKNCGAGRGRAGRGGAKGGCRTGAPTPRSLTTLHALPHAGMRPDFGPAGEGGFPNEGEEVRCATPHLTRSCARPTRSPALTAPLPPLRSASPTPSRCSALRRTCASCAPRRKRRACRTCS